MEINKLYYVSLSAAAHCVSASEAQGAGHLDWTEPPSGLRCMPQYAEELIGSPSACAPLTQHRPALSALHLSSPLPLPLPQAAMASDQSGM